jgi:hypothetical protein
MATIICNQTERTLGVIGTETLLTDSECKRLYVGDKVEILSTDKRVNNVCLVVESCGEKYIMGIQSHWCQKEDGVIKMYSGAWTVKKVASYEELSEDDPCMKNYRIAEKVEDTSGQEMFETFMMSVVEKSKNRLEEVLIATRYCTVDKNCVDCPFEAKSKNDKSDMCRFIMDYTGTFLEGRDKSLEAIIGYIVEFM